MDDTTDNNNGNEPLNNNTTNNEVSMTDTNDNDTQHGISSAAASNNNSQVGAPSTQNNIQDDAPSTTNNNVATNNNDTADNNNNRVTFSINNDSLSAQPTTQATTNNNQIIPQQSTTNSVGLSNNSNIIHPTLPFLITHWLSNYTTSLPSTTLSSSAIAITSASGISINKEKERALQTIQNQSIILANAFETLGEFGTSSTALLGGLEGSNRVDGKLQGSKEGKVEGTRCTTYSDLKRKYSPLLQIGNGISSVSYGGSISKVGGNQSERYVILFMSYIVVVCYWVLLGGKCLLLLD